MSTDYSRLFAVIPSLLVENLVFGKIEKFLQPQKKVDLASLEIATPEPRETFRLFLFAI